jgi:hypothetical protein
MMMKHTHLTLVSSHPRREEGGREGGRGGGEGERERESFIRNYPRRNTSLPPPQLVTLAMSLSLTASLRYTKKDMEDAEAGYATSSTSRTH